MKTLLFILLLFPVFSFSQKDCKYDINTFDQFIKIHKVEKSVKISSHYDGLIELNFCKYDSSIFFRLHAIEDNPIAIGKYDALIFLLSDNSTVKAFPDQIYSCDISTVSGTITMDATYYFENKNDFEQLKKNKVKSIRIYYNSVYSDYKIKDKFSEALFNTVICF